jgi:hypothetical protein
MRCLGTLTARNPSSQATSRHVAPTPAKRLKQSGGLEVPGSSPGAPTVMNSLQNWLDRLLGRTEKAATPGPTRDPNEQEYEDERKRKLLGEDDEQSREDRQKEFMDEQVRQRDDDESNLGDASP